MCQPVSAVKNDRVPFLILHVSMSQLLDATDQCFNL